MPQLFMLVVALLIGQTASAATFRTQQVDSGGVVISLSGTIALDDEIELGRLIQPYAKGILVLNSNGGNLYAGLTIGRTIRDKGFVTLVERNCYSACALIWLAGRERFLGARATIGFHAASEKLDDGTREVTSSGNALVGAYLAKLGLSDQAVIFATRADPTEIAILTPARAAQLGIAYRAFPPTESPTPAPRPPIIAAPVMPSVAPRAMAIGPSYDCTKASTASAQLICADTDLSRIDVELVQPYYVLRHLVGPAGWKALMVEAVAAMDATLLACGIDPTGNLLPANRAALKNCLVSTYGRQRTYWISKLRGAGLQEGTRAITHHILLQQRLQNLGFLPQTEKVDGIYGTATRVAITNWQTSVGLSPTGVLGNEDAARLFGAGLTSAR